MIIRTVVVLCCCLLYLNVENVQARRIRVRPLTQEEEEQYYSAAEAQDEQQQNQQVVYVSSADQYNGLYGQPTASSRAGHENEYLPRVKPTSSPSLRTKEPSKSPPVQTIRNYNKVNDDGSFTFGYEAADGSFKEETRGTDCVVRGKYGYIDPDGNKREFTYVSGNPCDPNAPKDETDESDEGEENSQSNENVPANYPVRPVRPIVRTQHVSPAPAKPVTLFQSNYEQGEDEQPEPEQVLRQQPIRRPTTYITRPQHYNENAYQTRAPPVYPSTTPATFLYRQPVQITPRPVTASTASQTQLPATTYRPQLIQVSVTPRPSILQTQGLSYASTTPSTPTTRSHFDTEFQRFQTDNHIASATPATLVKTTPKHGQIYSSALVYDPSTGQYNTQLYQTLPQTNGDFSVNHRIQPYVAQQTHRPINIQQLQAAQNPLYRNVVNPQQVYQRQQAENQFQNSAQLYVQQQKARALQARQQPQAQQQQQYYYVQPQNEQDSGNLAAFLRGHNIQF